RTSFAEPAKSIARFGELTPLQESVDQQRLIATWKREKAMPEKKTIRRARRAKARGKAPSTQAGEFVREEIHHIRAGKRGARSTRQAIAIGLSKARRAGVKLSPPRR